MPCLSRPQLFKFSIFVATPVAVALVTTHPVLREYVLRLVSAACFRAAFPTARCLALREPRSR